MTMSRLCRSLLLGWLVVFGGLFSIAAQAGEPAGGAATSQPNAGASPWAFAAVADNRAADERPAGSYEGVLAEIREMPANPDPKFPPIEFVLAAGDIKTSANGHANWDLWLETFKKATLKPAYFPVIGNWDDGDDWFNRKVILPAQKGVVGDDPEKYYVDWKNVRLIVSRDTPYVAKTIDSAPKAIQHIFIADHYPIFPRYNYAGPPDAAGIEFWKMLLKHTDRVRAMLVGHTHHYSRMRVANPTGPARNPRTFPDEPGGIFLIDCGNAGRAVHGEDATTLVQIKIDGPRAYLRTMQADNATPTKFHVADQCELTAPPKGPTSQPGGT